MRSDHRIIEIRIAEPYFEFMQQIQNQLHLNSLQEVVELMLDVFIAEALGDPRHEDDDRSALVAAARDRPFVGG